MSALGREHVADIAARPANVCFTPESGHCSAQQGCPLCAKLRPANHSITLSARTRNDSGIFRPIAFAAFKFTTNSNLTDICTGRSAGFAPRKIWSMYVAACRYESAGTLP